MWNDNWREELERDFENVYTRLCECRNTKNDIIIMSRIMYEYNPNKSAEECLDRMIEWVGEWNNQYDLIDTILPQEYDNMLNKI